MDDHDHDEPQAAEREAAIAEQALAVGDAVHALYHLANALFDTAGEDTYLDLARRVLEASSIEQLFDPDNRNDRNLVTKAVLLHLAGRDAEGLKLLAWVAEYCRDLPLERWLAPWIRDASERLDPDAFRSYLMIPAYTTIGRMQLRPAEVQHATDLAAVADALVDREDTGGAPMLLAAASSVYRRAHRIGDALRVAERSVIMNESDVPLAMLALAKRAAGDHEGARHTFERTLTFDTHPREADLGRIAWEAGALDVALRHFELARVQSPTDPELTVCVGWLSHANAVRPSREGLWERVKRATLGPKQPQSDSLAAQGAEYEAQVGRALRPDDTVLIPMPWIGWLPESRDASIKVLRQMLSNGQTFRRSAVSHLEAPSVRLAIAWATGTPDAASVDYMAATIPEDPDPREPWDDVPFVLWRYEDKVPFPALPAPSAEVLAAVGDLARLPFYLPRWWEEASRVGPMLGPSRVRELAAAMVHGAREAPEGIPAWAWLQRQQLAAALLIARVDARPTAEGPAWLTLEAILCGPHDWAVEAAIVAAAELAFEHPHFEPLVCTTFEALLDNTPREGDVCWLAALNTILPRLPRAGGYLRERCAPRPQES